MPRRKNKNKNQPIVVSLQSPLKKAKTRRSGARNRGGNGGGNGNMLQASQGSGLNRNAGNYVTTPGTMTSQNRTPNLRMVNNHLIGQEIVTITDRSTEDGIFASIPSNPAFWNGTRIATLIQMYAYYAPRKFAIEYVPAVGATRDGFVYGGTVWNRGIPPSNAALVLTNGGFQVAVWQWSRANVDCRKLTQPMFDVEGSVAPNTVPFNYLLGTEGFVTKPGFIWIHYDFEVSQPTYPTVTASMPTYFDGSVINPDLQTRKLNLRAVTVFPFLVDVAVNVAAFLLKPLLDWGVGQILQLFKRSTGINPNLLTADDDLDMYWTIDGNRVDLPPGTMVQPMISRKITSGIAQQVLPTPDPGVPLPPAYGWTPSLRITYMQHNYLTGESPAFSGAFTITSPQTQVMNPALFSLTNVGVPGSYFPPFNRVVGSYCAGVLVAKAFDYDASKEVVVFCYSARSAQPGDNYAVGDFIYAAAQTMSGSIRAWTPDQAGLGNVFWSIDEPVYIQETTYQAPFDYHTLINCDVGTFRYMNADMPPGRSQSHSYRLDYVTGGYRAAQLSWTMIRMKRMFLSEAFTFEYTLEDNLMMKFRQLYLFDRPQPILNLLRDAGTGHTEPMFHDDSGLSQETAVDHTVAVNAS